MKNIIFKINAVTVNHAAQKIRKISPEIKSNELNDAYITNDSIFQIVDDIGCELFENAGGKFDSTWNPDDQKLFELCIEHAIDLLSNSINPA